MSAAPGIRALRAHVFRWKVETPIRTSFGTMHDRPMVLVEVEGEDGVRGWGEAWCNFPAVGAEHRARLLASVFAPMVVGRSEDAATLFADLTRRTAVLAIQSGEPGPIAQCIAGIDTALWDLAARRAGEPLWRFLGGRDPQIPVYASGLNPESPEVMAAARQREGYTGFKLKVGFGAERDLANLKALRKTLGRDARLMVDANQGWSLSEALEIFPRLAQFHLAWVEEPLRADAAIDEWCQLWAASPISIAAGENMAGDESFDAAIASGAFHVLQPDIAKWGGFTGCLPVARRILAAGIRYCPHYLGGGIGLLASAHLLAAAGGDGWLEVDANPNPLRTDFAGPLNQVASGRARLSELPGLGIEIDLASVPQPRVSFGE